MSIEVRKLLAKFRPIDDMETEIASFLTRVPSVAPKAYLNIIFKPAEKGRRDEIAKELHLPPALENFYSETNGLILFSDAFRVYGILPERYFLDRKNSFTLPPYNILDANEEFSSELRHRNLVCIGSYGYDRSLVCINRESEQVACLVGTDFSRIRREWASFYQWISEEIQRLSLFFDENGNRLVSGIELLPSQESIRRM